MQTTLLSFFGGDRVQPVQELPAEQKSKGTKRNRIMVAPTAEAAVSKHTSRPSVRQAAVTNSKKAGSRKSAPKNAQAIAAEMTRTTIHKEHSNQTIFKLGGENSPVKCPMGRQRRASTRHAALAASAKLREQEGTPTSPACPSTNENALDSSFSSILTNPKPLDPPDRRAMRSRHSLTSAPRGAAAKLAAAKASGNGQRKMHTRHASLTGWRSYLDQTVARRRRAAPCMWDVSHVASVDVSATHEAQGVNAYTMSFLNNGSALATGGQHGLASIAYLPPGARGGSQFAPPDGELPLCEAVVQWSAHERWVSDMRQADGASTMLTSSDDGTLAVWSIPSELDSASVWCPPLLDRRSVHDAGVYSCDAATKGSADSAASFYAVSGSKDSSVHVCSVDSAGQLLPIRRWVNAHDGVVKCVRWRRDHSANTFASCGNDKAVRVWDVRCSSAALQVPDAHKLSVNTVAWSPCGTFVLSSSFDNTLKLWDCRAAGKELLSAPTVPGNTAERSNSIIHPAFFMGGRVILVPLPKSSCVWTLDALTGKPLPAGEDSDGKLEVVAEDLPVPPSVMAVSEDTGFTTGSRVRAGLMIATSHNRRSQVWEVMGQNCC